MSVSPGTRKHQDRSVIWKIVITEPDGQTFTVPTTARFISVGADPAGQGMALWFRWAMPHDAYTGEHYTKTWTLGFAGTGHPFPYSATVLGTVLVDQFAFHVLDMDGKATS